MVLFQEVVHKGRPLQITDVIPVLEANRPVNFKFAFSWRSAGPGARLVAVNEEMIFPPFRVDLDKFVEIYILFIIPLLSYDIDKIICVVGGL